MTTYTPAPPWTTGDEVVDDKGVKYTVDANGDLCLAPVEDQDNQAAPQVPLDGSLCPNTVISESKNVEDAIFALAKAPNSDTTYSFTNAVPSATDPLTCIVTVLDSNGVSQTISIPKPEIPSDTGVYINGVVAPVIDLAAQTITYTTINDGDGTAGTPLVQDISALMAFLTSPNYVSGTNITFTTLANGDVEISGADTFGTLAANPDGSYTWNPAGGGAAVSIPAPIVEVGPAIESDDEDAANIPPLTAPNTLAPVLKPGSDLLRGFQTQTGFKRNVAHQIERVHQTPTFNFLAPFADFLAVGPMVFIYGPEQPIVLPDDEHCDLQYEFFALCLPISIGTNRDQDEPFETEQFLESDWLDLAAGNAPAIPPVFGILGGSFPMQAGGGDGTVATGLNTQRSSDSFHISRYQRVVVPAGSGGVTVTFRPSMRIRADSLEKMQTHIGALTAAQIFYSISFRGRIAANDYSLFDAGGALV